MLHPRKTAVPPFFKLVWATAYTLRMCRRALVAVRRGGGREIVQDLTKQWADGLATRMQIEVVAYGLERFDPTVPCIVMANHQSYLDVLALYHALPRTFGIVAKKGLFAVPFFGGVMRALGCVAVDRGKRGEAMTAMRDAAERVRQGSTVAVFPEGTRSPGDRIAPLKKGAFYLAQLAQVPTVPIGIRGSAALMPRENTGIRPGVIEVHAGRPIPPAGPGAKGRDALMDRVRQELSRLTELPMRD